MSGIDRDSNDDPATGGEAADPEPPAQAGVLGNLPRKRPSVRSPRRAEAKPAAVPGAESAAGGTEAEPAPAASADPPAAAAEHSHVADLESLARGGIAAAGGAASLGLRIAGRAAAALRDAVERR